jgi:hypothetical protein
MAAAPHIPYEEPETAYNISIGSGFTPTPQGVKLGVSQSITFTNNSGAEIGSIVFQANPPLPAPNAGPILFPNTITNLANGATSSVLPPNQAAGSVNYLIFDESGNQYGPYSIQLGTAIPLMIAILESESYPVNAAVPVQGTAAIYSADTPCFQYPITWGAKGNPFTTTVPSAGCGFSSNATRTANASANNYPYTFVGPAQNPGGGHIVIQN